jgi:hypothetical protein
MKKVIILLTLTLSFLYSAAPPVIYNSDNTQNIQSYNTYLSELDSLNTAYLATIEKNNRISRLLQAFIQQESRGKTFAYNKEENAAGILQIRFTMLNSFNKLTGKKYTMQDRYNPEISIEIWKTIMENRNPEYDMKKAVLIWNGKGKTGNGSPKYYRELSQKYNALTCVSSYNKL